MTERRATFKFRSMFWLLAGVGTIILLLLSILSTNISPATLVKIFTLRFLGIFIEAAPFLLLGTLASGLIDVFVRRDDLVRWIPRNPFLAALAGAFMGFAFPVCECGVVPVTRRLFNKGLPMSVGVAFLLAAPVMNPIVMVATYIAFWQIAPGIVIGRFVITLIVTVCVGLLFALSARPQDVLRPASMLPVMGGSGAFTPPRQPLRAGLLQAVHTAGDEFFEMGRYLVAGTMLAAGLQTLVAQDVLLSLGSGPVLSVVLMQVLAFVLSVCSTVDSFLALAFYGTFTTGSVLAFLTFGPMVDIKSTLMFLGVFKRKVVVYLIVLPFLMTLLIGIWTNLYFKF